MNSDQVCLRRLIPHVELEIFGEALNRLVVSKINDMALAMSPITDYHTRACLVHINGEPQTLLEVWA